MSFDLAILHLERPIDRSEAEEMYAELCEGNTGVVTPGEESIENFLAELTGRYPQIDDYSDDEVDDCPWSVEFDITDGSVLICMVWSRAEEVSPFVMQLAAKHNLACYDPQDGKLQLPRNFPGAG